MEGSEVAFHTDTRSMTTKYTFFPSTSYNKEASIQTLTFFSKNSVHSFSPQLLEMEPSMTPSHRTVGEK